MPEQTKPQSALDFPNHRKHVEALVADTSKADEARAAREKREADKAAAKAQENLDYRAALEQHFRTLSPDRMKQPFFIDELRVLFPPRHQGTVASHALLAAALRALGFTRLRDYRVEARMKTFWLAPGVEQVDRRFSGKEGTDRDNYRGFPRSPSKRLKDPKQRGENR